MESKDTITFLNNKGLKNICLGNKNSITFAHQLKNQNRFMKKLLSIMLCACFAALVSCGPSAEEKAAMEKHRQDSIAAAQKAIDDSVSAVKAAADAKAKADSANMAMMEKARQDSMEAANKKKPAKA